ncbi:MAG: 30S ribosomal protein S5 [Candidatus Pacebacteria bacterium]|jgi:small subunit ribosomal protein S5|nr:30S ribosomal protein S5 [Candidatus Paceibacterota bacterium]
MDTPTTKPHTDRKPGGFGGRPSRPGARGGERRPPRAQFERPKPEFDQKMLDIRRVTRVVAGGRRFSFSVALVAGDRKGSVGFGMGKSMDTSLAITKAFKSAKKNMLKLKLTKDGSIPYDVSAKYASSKVFIMPNRGRGLVAGSAVRDILNFAGIKNVTAKVNSGSKNKLNNAKATMLALSRFAVKGVPPVSETEKPSEDKESNS